MIEHLVIFGATGDVTKRFIFPALAQVFAHRGRPTEYRITGVGRREWTTSRFQEHVAEALDEHEPPIPPRACEGLIQSLEYVRVEDLSNPEQIGAIFNGSAGSTLIYLGLPSQMFPPVLKALSKIPLPQEFRIVIEKPFGLSYAESKELNRLLHRLLPEESIFRIDHFLGLPIISTILGLRFGNPIFTPIWNRDHIQKVEIIWDETLALEGRAAYYDRAGALKDMIQNHLLQLLAVLTLEPLETMWSSAFRDKREELFRSVRKLSKAEIEAHTVRARYGSGQIFDVKVPDYVEEEGVVPERKTETFAQVTVWVDNERWKGVPFVLRSGKALSRDRKEVLVYFVDVQDIAEFPILKGGEHVLRLNIESAEVNFGLFTIQKTKGMTPEVASVDDPISPEHLSPYERLFLEAMSGESRLFVRNDEAEEMWTIIQPIADGWAESLVPLQMYRAGTDGPP